MIECEQFENLEQIRDDIDNDIENSTIFNKIIQDFNNDEISDKIIKHICCCFKEKKKIYNDYIDENLATDSYNDNDNDHQQLVLFKNQFRNTANTLYPLRCSDIINESWMIIQREIIEQDIELNEINTNFNKIINEIVINKDEIYNIFIYMYGDNTPLIKEIINNECHDFDINNVIKIRDWISKLRHSEKYKKMEQCNNKLTDNELIAIIYFSDSNSNCHKYHHQDTDNDNSLRWKHLYWFIRNGINKLYKMDFIDDNEYDDNGEYIDDDQSCFISTTNKSMQQIIDRKIPLIFKTFSQTKYHRTKYGQQTNIMIENIKVGLKNGKLFGANISKFLPPSDKERNKYMILSKSFNNNNNMIKINENEYNLRFEITRNDDITQFDNDKINEIKQEIIRIFKIQFNLKLAQNIKESFCNVLNGEEFYEIETIWDDIKDEDQSSIFERIFNDLNEKNIRYSYNDKRKIIKCLQNIVNGTNNNNGSFYKLFAIKDFTFTVKLKDVKEATKIMEKLLINEQLYGNTNNASIIAQDKSLCIAKAIDIKNGYPILKWLLDSFCRDRMIGHKLKFKNNNSNKYQYCFDEYVTGYNATRWFLQDNLYCKFIQYKNTKMALPLMTAIQSMSKRVLPQINFNPNVSYIIYDDFNHFIKYIFASWSFSHKLTQNMSRINLHCNYNPIQFDFWFIPKSTKMNEMNGTPFDVNELKQQQPQQQQYQETNNNNNNNNNVLSDRDGNKLCNNLEKHLEKHGYIQNIDFWSQFVDEKRQSIEKQFHSMWKNANGENKRYCRYIFIVDRRNKIKIYLIKPKKYNLISYNFECEPEICWINSKNYLFPPNISVNDILNGYKFVLSYHLFSDICSNVYWYFNNGSTKFELQDVEWLFPRYFYKNEKLNKVNSSLLKECMNKKQLKDIKWSSFYQQCHAMKIIK